MFGGSQPALGPHQDVLNAEPSDDSSKENLVEEIKRRAKGSIGSKNWPEAIQLYSKAIEILPNAILYANRSMCHLNMKKLDEALTDAKTSVDIDSNYAKGYYRKGCAHIALKEYKSAHTALTKGMELVPNDKSMKTQLDMVIRELDKLAAAGKPLDGKNSTEKTSSSSTTTTTTTSSSTTSSKPKPETNKTSTSKPKPIASSAEDDEDEEEIGGHVRGYKTTSDGRKTTFFNNEMDDKTKALIGDITPKTIDAASIKEPVVENGSAWNSAGTFEAKDQSKWMKDQLEACFTDLTWNKTNSSGNTWAAKVDIKKVKSAKGDAEIVSARGKTKYIYDFTVEIDYQMTIAEDESRLSEGTDIKAINGSITIEDITADLEYESQFTNDDAGGKLMRSDKLADAAFRSCIRDDSSDSFRGFLYSKLKEVHSSFLSKGR